jgi:hypothetical protein
MVIAFAVGNQFNATRCRGVSEVVRDTTLAVLVAQRSYGMRIGSVNGLDVSCALTVIRSHLGSRK